MTDKNITSLIGELVQLTVESAVTVDQASGSGLALYVGSKRPKHYMLYDSHGLLHGLKHFDYRTDAGTSLIKHVYGIVSTVRHATKTLNFAVVEAAGARSKYGPLLYDIAMSNENGLTSDRVSVSPDAKHVWVYYMTKRPDVEKKFLDDAVVYKGGRKNPLNYVYYLKTGPQIIEMVREHKRTVSKLNASKIQASERYFDALGDSFFDRMYGH